MMETDSNLDNIKQKEIPTLFGVPEVQALNSVKDRIGFLPISVWKPDWDITKEWKKLIGDDGSTRELVGKKMQLMGSKTSVSIFNPHLAIMFMEGYALARRNIFNALTPLHRRGEGE